MEMMMTISFMLFITLEFVLFRHAMVCIDSEYEIFGWYRDTMLKSKTLAEYGEVLASYSRFLNRGCHEPN